LPGLGKQRQQERRPAAAKLLRGAAGALGLFALVALAAAHVVYTPTTLREWVKGADLIAVVEITRPLSVWRAEDGSDLQEYISARIVEAIAGEPPSGSLDFLPHSEGEPRYRAGERALLFLESTKPRAEFAALAARFPFFSRQGAGSEWKLAGADDPVLEMARAWAALPAAAAPGEVRSLLLRQLVIGDARLRRDAILELVRFRRQADAWPDAAAVEPFARLAAAPSLDVTERIALVRVLDGAPGFDAAAHLLPLTGVRLDDGARKALVGAAALSRDARLSDWLASGLADPDPRVRRAAATALAHPWHAAHVAALTALATNDPDEGVARAAVQSLAAIDDAAARAGLAAVAEERRDSAAATARRLLRDRSRSPPHAG
jgi:hypothetical protein